MSTIAQERTAETTERERKITLDLLERLLGNAVPADFGFVLWDGTTWGNVGGNCTIALTHPGALRSMFIPPTDLNVGEAFLRGDFEVLGSMERAVELGLHMAESPRNPTDTLAAAALLLRLPSKSHSWGRDSAAELSGEEHSRERDSEAISYHYDVGNDFYALWLDEQMTYSCAYFEDASQDLDSAQRGKFEHVCRKLRLQPGDRLLDIGCGWGGLLRHAARHHDVEGVGITLSEEQADLAESRAREDGMSDRLSFHVLDYRDAGAFGTFDKLASVGMFEHVGAKMLPEYFDRALALLKPGGLFLNHGIASERGTEMRKRSFLLKYVFPDGQLEAISEVLAAAEDSGFEIRDVESLREHYAMTLRHWIERLEANATRAAEVANETTYRIWRLYMAGSAVNFKRGRINVYQTLMRKPTGGESGLPLTRAYLYDE